MSGLLLMILLSLLVLSGSERGLIVTGDRASTLLELRCRTYG
jgi:hypothetical protein